ncbi:MAG: methyltransferase domain-containing protein [Deltaproteobacteria bacterium]|nr:methyltransferase domain-containing protein [Deltaproteobacteria bacterium]
MAWYKEWFGEDYLELYAHRDHREATAHIDFVEDRLLPQDVEHSRKPLAVLDLACGAGRHTEELRHRGYRALGVDLSLTLLAVGADLPRVGGDMRYLPFADGTFDWILNFFTAFGYFEEERENFRVLEEVVRILRPGGRFMIDFFNTEKVLKSLKPKETAVRDGRTVEIERWFDVTARRINKRIRIHTEGQPARTFLESVRAYTSEEMTCGLHWAGLEVDGLYGSFSGEVFTADSDRLIILGHRPKH